VRIHLIDGYGESVHIALPRQSPTSQTLGTLPAHCTRNGVLCCWLVARPNGNVEFELTQSKVANNGLSDVRNKHIACLIENSSKKGVRSAYSGLDRTNLEVAVQNVTRV